MSETMLSNSFWLLKHLLSVNEFIMHE